MTVPEPRWRVDFSALREAVTKTPEPTQVEDEIQEGRIRLLGTNAVVIGPDERKD